MCMVGQWQLPVNEFNWVEETSEFNEGYFLEAGVQYSENLHNLISNLTNKYVLSNALAQVTTFEVINTKLK